MPVRSIREQLSHSSLLTRDCQLNPTRWSVARSRSRIDIVCNCIVPTGASCRPARPAIRPRLPPPAARRARAGCLPAGGRRSRGSLRSSAPSTTAHRDRLVMQPAASPHRGAVTYRVAAPPARWRALRWIAAHRGQCVPSPRPALWDAGGQQERNRAGWRCAAGGRSCAPLAEVLWGTQQRATGAVVTTLLSVFVTVLCVTRILVSQFAGTGDGSDKTLCHANEGGRFAGYLVAYWILLLVVLIGLLWRDLRSKELKRLSRQSRRMEERESGREEDRSRSETVFDARGLRPERTSAGRADDGYSSGGEDDPNWRGRRRLNGSSG